MEKKFTGHEPIEDVIDYLSGMKARHPELRDLDPVRAGHYILAGMRGETARNYKVDQNYDVLTALIEFVAMDTDITEIDTYLDGGAGRYAMEHLRGPRWWEQPR
ncbi:hypothetical protein [Nocardia sp. NPDC052566]|uniref:hypothetical protein n=1 Tax=Nocardia sp. NPDC052566 TaxID=3364330 RepID=UPI0037CA835B